MLTMNNDLEGALKAYLTLLDEEEYFDAHEALEEAWHPLRLSDHPLKNLVKAFINAAVSFEHLKRNRDEAGRKARRVMESYERHKGLYSDDIEYAVLFKMAMLKIETLKVQNPGVFDHHSKGIMFWYHNMTKHSYNSVRTNPNRLSWEDQPSTYKNYPESYKKQKLDLGKEEENFLYHIAGLTAKKTYPSGEYYLRINPSAGALYPNELYFQARGVEGIEDGIYHYEVHSSSLTLLKSIFKEEGLEPYMGYKNAMKGYLFLVSAIYYRSAWKYKERAFRYCLLDAGHLLGSIEAAALLKPHATQIRYNIEREKLNRMFGFEGREWFLAGASVAVPLKEQLVSAVEFELPYVEGSRTFESVPLIEEAYEASSIIDAPKKVTKAPKFSYREESLKETIFNRRSQRGFEEGAITKGQFNYLMDVLHQPILSDADEEVNIYVVVNRVLDMPLGLYKNGEYIKYGDFAKKAGYLSLEQYSLSTQGALAFFLTSKGDNYQALYQKAGIIGHRLYIASLYLGIGCSGIGAYYDDEVNAFVGNDEMVLYALAIGK